MEGWSNEMALASRILTQFDDIDPTKVLDDDRMRAIVNATEAQWDRLMVLLPANEQAGLLAAMVRYRFLSNQESGNAFTDIAFDIARTMRDNLIRYGDRAKAPSARQWRVTRDKLRETYRAEPVSDEWFDKFLRSLTPLAIKKES
jgi:DNA-binding cell septation regulator SpoVG